MKIFLKKYRSVLIIGSSLTFNLVSSLLVWHPEGQIFNPSPIATIEWVCDIISSVTFFIGLVMMFLDIHDDEKQKIKEAILESNEELKHDKNAAVCFKAKEN